MEKCGVYLVDDERYIVEGLAATYPWDEMGAVVLGYAVNPEKAVGEIAELKPDIVLTDIRMKQMTGLDMIRYVKERGVENIVWIIMSAYKDFEYAKTACTLGAFDYLLKPIDEDELCDAVQRARRQIDKTRKEKRTMDQYENFATGNVKAFAKYLVSEYGGNKIDKEHLTGFLGKIIHKNWRQMYFRGVYFRIETMLADETEYTMLNQRVIDLFEEEAGKGYICLNFQNTYKSMFMIIGMEPGKILEDGRIKEMAERIEEALRVSLSFEVTRKELGIEGLKKVYLEGVTRAELWKSDDDECGFKKNQSNSEYIEKALKYINANLKNEDLNIGMAAERVHLNPAYFGRMFHKVMNVSFKQYLLEERINEARRLLEDTDKTVVEVGELVGIVNPSYFTQQFKKITGILPTEYRKYHNEKKK